MLLKSPANSYKLHVEFSGKSWATCINNMTGKYIKKVQWAIDQRWNTDYLNDQEKAMFENYINNLDEKKLKRISAIYVAKIEMEKE